MHTRTESYLRLASCCSLAYVLWSGAAVREVRAQDLLCPSNTPLINGQCGDGAFSGAAQASQALSSLSQTSSQESSRNTLKTLEKRREKVREACAAGYRRVDGECEPISPPERKAEAVPPPPPTPTVKKAKKPKIAVTPPKEERLPAAKAARRERLQPKPREAEVAAPPPMVCKDGPCAPIPIEPPTLFGTWVQIYGDYEHRNGSSPAFVSNPAVPQLGLVGSLVPVQASATSRSTAAGIQAGGDFTTRGIWHSDDGLIAGALVGFNFTDLTFNTSALSSNFALVHNLSGNMHATLTGGTVGLYATYFDGPFSADLLAKADVFSLYQTFTDLLAYPSNSTAQIPTRMPAPGIGGLPNGCAPIQGVLPPIGAPFDCLFGVTDPIPVIDTTVAGDVNYRFILNPNFWVEPTVGAQFTNTTYTNSFKASRLGLANGDLVMVQGGARLGTTSLLNNGILMTTVLTGLIYDDVVVSGGFIPGLAFQGNNLLVQSDRGQVRGRGIFALNFDFGEGWSSYVLADLRGGKDLFGVGGKAGIRYQW